MAMKSHSRQYTVEVRPMAVFVHDGKKRKAQALYSYLVDGIQVDYYVVTPDSGVSRDAFQRASVEAWHHSRNLGNVIIPLSRQKRKRPNPKVRRSDDDGKTQRRLL